MTRKRGEPRPRQATEQGAGEPQETASAAAARVVTPRELAAILNPGRDAERRAHADRAEPTAAPAAAVAAAAPRLPFRERALARTGDAELLIFRVGPELFAMELAAIDEAVENPSVQSLPDMPAGMLGVFPLRERMLPVYAPTQPLGVALVTDGAATVVVRSGDRRLGLAVDEVEDVLVLTLSSLRTAPGVGDPDGVLLGVARYGAELVAVLDVDALVAACLSDALVNPGAAP